MFIKRFLLIMGIMFSCSNTQYVDPVKENEVYYKELCTDIVCENADTQEEFIDDYTGNIYFLCQWSCKELKNKTVDVTIQWSRTNLDDDMCFKKVYYEETIAGCSL